MHVIRCLPIALAMGLAPAAAAAQPGPAPLALEEAIARAFEASHRLAEARARGEAADAAVRGREAAARPTVTASAGYTRTNHVDEFGVPFPDGTLRIIYPDVPDNVLTRVAFAWPIFTSGRLDALERAARAEAAAVAAEIETARADLRLEVVRSYWALATAGESVRVLEHALALADAHLDVVRARLETGLVPPNEVLSAQAQRSRQQMLLIEARTRHEASAILLRRLIGMPAEQPLTLADRLDAGGPRVADPPDPGPLLEAALAARPERRALLRRLEGAEARSRAAAAARRPWVSLAGNVDYANPNPRIFPRQDLWRESWDVGVHVSWTLWDAGRSAAERGEAAAGVAAVRARLADLEAEVSADVRLRLLDLESARAAVSAAADGVQASAEARRVVAERFDAGVATSTDVLDAQAVLLDAELDRTRAMAGVRLAEARIERALGR